MHASTSPGAVSQQQVGIRSRCCRPAAVSHVKVANQKVTGVNRGEFSLVNTPGTVRQSTHCHRADQQHTRSRSDRATSRPTHSQHTSHVGSVDDRNAFKGAVSDVQSQQQRHLMRSKGHNPKHIDAKKLTANLKGTRNPQQLLQLVRQHCQQFDYIHTAAAFTQLGQWQRKQQLTTAEEQAVAQLLQELEQLMLSQHHLQHAEPRQLSNIVWACSLLRYTGTPMYRMCLQEFCAKLHAVTSLQDVSNILYGLAESGQQIEQSMLQQLLAVTSQHTVLYSSPVQNITNIVWSVAKLQQHIPQEQLRQLLVCLISKSAELMPQEISNTLWGLATMGAFSSWSHLNQLESAFVGQLSRAKAVELSNFLWASAVLQYYPEQLLSTLLKSGDICQSLLSAMKPQELANVGFALGALGAGSMQEIMAQVLRQSLHLVKKARSASADAVAACVQFKVQELCNLCWAVAVLDLQHHIPDVMALMRLCAERYNSCSRVELRQIHQVQLWLQDVQGPDAAGLSSVFSSKQLQQCKALWITHLPQFATEEGRFCQSEVFAVLQQLPLQWREAPAMEQLARPDGMFSIDISAVSVKDVHVAIEVDGPYHFRRPDNTPTGSTLYRNKALAARGYELVIVPVYEWQRLTSTLEKQQYLLRLMQNVSQPSVLELQATVAQVAAKQQSPQHVQAHIQQRLQGNMAPSTATGRLRRRRRHIADS